MLKVFADSESPMVFTTESIHAVLGFTFKCMGNAVLSDGETPKEVVFSSEMVRHFCISSTAYAWF